MNQPYLTPYADQLDLSLIERHCQEQEQKLRPKQLPPKAPGLDRVAKTVDPSCDFVTIGSADEISEEEKLIVTEQLKQCIPWRKGPFKLFGIDIDAEWRSDYKWNRLAQSIAPLKDRKVLDVGCNNGYYMFRMLEHHPKLVMGIDPSLHCQQQFDLLQSYARFPSLHFELLGIEHLHLFPNFFDTIFCMGIIYHHRHPIQQLLDLHHALAPGGEVILETIGIPGSESYALFPESRYANMKNVWFIPTLSCFVNWAKKAHFKNVEVISDTLLTPDEQRNTIWCPDPFQSLDKFLDPHDPSLTIEGHPAPRRFSIKATKSK